MAVGLAVNCKDGFNVVEFRSVGDSESAVIHSKVDFDDNKD
jgi:hypothetical protein